MLYLLCYSGKKGKLRNQLYIADVVLYKEHEQNTGTDSERKWEVLVIPGTTRMGLS